MCVSNAPCVVRTEILSLDLNASLERRRKKSLSTTVVLFTQCAVQFVDFKPGKTFPEI